MHVITSLWLVFVRPYVGRSRVLLWYGAIVIAITAAQLLIVNVTHAQAAHSQITDTQIKSAQIISTQTTHAGELHQASLSAKTPKTFVHLFEWHWNDIARECEDFLGPKGFSAVQISPANEHLNHHTWWARYQPISYSKLTSRSGTEQELREMIQRCKKAGVNIYADIVMNNWANFPDAGNRGSAGSEWQPRHYPDLGPDDFHSPWCGIDGYTLAKTVWYCDLYGMPDLKTGAEKSQNYVADYMKRLTAMGVAGFRIDAAKHIAPFELDEILAKAGRPWVFLEVIGTPGEAPEIHPREYLPLGVVTDFRYGVQLATAFHGDIKNLRHFSHHEELLPAEQALVFVDNHDRERGHGGTGNLTYKDDKRYRLANIFMLAYPFGYPGIMSGYQFTDEDIGPPAGVTNCSNNAWVCQHRWPEVANMVGFRQYVGDAPLQHWWDNGNNRIAFARGDKGFVAINNTAQPLRQHLLTGLPKGKYCNVLADLQECSGAVIQVDRRGYARISVPPMSALAIYGAHQQR